VREECGLDLPASALRLAAVISIDRGQARTGVLLLVFVARVEHQNQLAPSAEGTLEWHPIAELDGLPLVPDPPWLLPRIWGTDGEFARYSYGASGLEISPADGARSRGT
jgi:hypothetical protein